MISLWKTNHAWRDVGALLLDATVVGALLLDATVTFPAPVSDGRLSVSDMLLKSVSTGIVPSSDSVSGQLPGCRLSHGYS